MISCVKFLKEKEIERKRCQWQPSFLSSPDITLPRMVCSFTIMHPIIKAIISANDLSAGTFSHEPTETRRPYLRYCVAAAIYEVARALAGLHELISGAAYVAWQSRGERRRGILQNKVNAITKSWGALCRVAEDARGSQGAALLLGCSGRFLTHQHVRFPTVFCCYGSAVNTSIVHTHT